jgi:hypothetical protein
VGSHEIRTSSGHQPGDPVRAAAAIIDATEAARPPHRLLLGNAAYEGAVAKLDTLRSEFLAGEAVARGADAPEKSNGRAA